MDGSKDPSHTANVRLVDRAAEAKRRFVEAAVALGATSPARARLDAELPRLSARQLQELLDQGIVREAAPGTFYVYRRTEVSDGAATAPSGWEDPAVQRRVISIAIWLLIALVPILYRSVSQMLR